MLRMSIRGNLHVCWEASVAMQHGQHAETVATLKFSEDPTRIVPCDAVAIGGKLVQNNGLELAPDRCCDTWDSPSAPSLSAGIAWRGLQLCCAGYFGQGCTPRERTCCYCKLTDRGPTGSTRAPCTMQQSCLRHRPSPVAPSGGTLSPTLAAAPGGAALSGRQVVGVSW